MVFLRLTVKVMPPEQVLHDQHLGGTFSSSDFDTDGHARNGIPRGKVIAFLVPIPNPEEVTLGALAGLIREKWKKLRPNSEPLGIKKLLHIDHPDENLDVDLTVADVFVQHGIKDERDQRGVAIIIQKPVNQPIVEREASVVQDWEGAAARSQLSLQRRQKSSCPNTKIATIDENEPLLSDYRGGKDLSPAPIGASLQGRPVISVEHEEVRQTIDYDELLHSNDSLHDENAVRANKRRLEDYGSRNSWSESSSDSVLYGREPSEELGISPSSEKSWIPWPFEKNPTFAGDDQLTEDGQEYLTSSKQHAPPKDNKKNNTATRKREANAENHGPDGDFSIVHTVPGPAQAQQKIGEDHSSIILIENKPIDNGHSLQHVAPKRKRTSAHGLPSAKEPRLESTPRPSTPTSQTSMMEGKNLIMPVHITDQVPPREGPPSFSSPQKGLDFTNRPAHIPEGSMGNPKAIAAEMAAIRLDTATNRLTNDSLPTSHEELVLNKTSPPKETTPRSASASASFIEDRIGGGELPSQGSIVRAGIKNPQANSPSFVSSAESLKLNRESKQQGAETKLNMKDPGDENKKLPKEQAKSKKETENEKAKPKSNGGKIEKKEIDQRKSFKQKTEDEKTENEKTKGKTKKRIKLGPLPTQLTDPNKFLRKAASPTQTGSQLQSSAPSEVSLPPLEKTRSKKSTASLPPQKTASTQQISSTIEEAKASKKTTKVKQSHSQPDSLTPKSQKSEVSHISTATKQLQSDLELASTQTSTKVHYTPLVSVEIPSGKSLSPKSSIAKQAPKSKKTKMPKPRQEESTSQSDSESESESDSDDESFVGVLKHLERNPAKLPSDKAASPRASGWNPVHANKRHTIKSVREELRKEMKIEKPNARVQAGANTNATKSKQPILESSSSDDSSD